MVKRVLIVIISWMHTVYFEQVCPLYYTLLTPLSPPLFFKQYLLSFIMVRYFDPLYSPVPFICPQPFLPTPPLTVSFLYSCPTFVTTTITTTTTTSTIIIILVLDSTYEQKCDMWLFELCLSHST
jgi:hypothetical protein